MSNNSTATARIFPSWWSEESLLIVVDVGIDESKSSETSLLVVSAIIGNTGQMKKMSKSWSRDLEAIGVDYFHAKDHWNGKSKPYHGIDRPAREKLAAQLISRITRRFDFGASALVNEDEYRREASDRFRSQYGSPYAFAFQMTMAIIFLELTRQGRANQPVNILIEDGHANARQAIALIEQKNKKRSNAGLTIGTYGLGRKIGQPVLQAADMLAYGVREFHATGESYFASELSRGSKYGQLLELPWNKASIKAVNEDIIRNSHMLNAGIMGAKHMNEMVMW